MPNKFDHINTYYDLSLKRGSTGLYKGRPATVIKADGQYLWLRLHGDTGDTGPYHPTSGLVWDSTNPE